MPYEQQTAELARLAVRHHGELQEVIFIDGNKEYSLVFADGTVLTPYNPESLKHEYSTYAGYGDIAQELGGTHPFSLLAFGYQGTGPGCFANFLKTAGFDVTEQVIVDISPPVRLRRDGSQVTGTGGGAAPEAPKEDAATPKTEPAAETPAPEPAAAVAEDPAPEPAQAPEPAAQAPVVPADWYADPMGRHQFRYWDGSSWTDHVADNGAASLDPLTATPAPVATQSAPAGPVEFDENGRVKKINFPQQSIWPERHSGQSTYMTRSVGTLLEATEALLKVGAIPSLHYYVAETPDGNLCRDMNDFYTEAPLKTKGLHLATQEAASGPVEFESLTEFGDMFANQSSVAALTQQGQYARLVLMMECGRCGYKSPVETQAGDMERECYCCGTMNKGSRGNVNVFMANGQGVAI